MSSMGFKVRGVGRQEQGAGLSGFTQSDGQLILMGSQVVHDDDVPGPQSGHQHLAHERAEDLCVGRDGRVEIDNNSVENSIRPIAIGKKNWLFIGAAEAGPRSAILYTIIESCRRRGINPFDYLRDVLSRLPSMTNWQVKDITPGAWAAARQHPPLTQAA
jgi:hypothetical protein